jgi:hypothetical protein
MALPVVFIALLVAIKKAVEGTESFSAKTVAASFPNNDNTTIPYSFNDYLTAIQAKRECFQVPGMPNFIITGMDFFTFKDEDFQYDTWLQIPFIKCDPDGCQRTGDDAATQFCEYQILALAPQDVSTTNGLARANSFRDFIYNKYPVLNDRTSLPFDYDFVQTFDSEAEIESYVKSRDYGTTGSPKIALAVVFPDSSGEKDYAYKIRVNSTNSNGPERNIDRKGMITTPPTGRLFNDYARVDESCPLEQGAATIGDREASCTVQYIYNGVLVIQRLLGDWIMNETGTTALGYGVAEHGVQFVSFPTLEYTYEGFYELIAGEFTFRLVNCSERLSLT